MVLEIVVGIGLITFVYAYLYAKTPEENEWFRFLFLGLTLFNIALVSWLIFSQPSEQIQTFSYDSSGNLTGYTIMNSTNENNVHGILTTYLGISIYVPYIVFAFVIIIFLYNIFVDLQKDRKEKRGY